jgi:hypothetical protein
MCRFSSSFSSLFADFCVGISFDQLKAVLFAHVEAHSGHLSKCWTMWLLVVDTRFPCNPTHVSDTRGCLESHKQKSTMLPSAQACTSVTFRSWSRGMGWGSAVAHKLVVSWPGQLQSKIVGTARGLVSEIGLFQKFQAR